MPVHRVYWIGLRLVANELKRYIERNRLKLQANLTTDQMTCVIALLDAAVTCLASLPTETPI